MYSLRAVRERRLAYFHQAYQALATIPSRYPRLIIIRGTHKFRVGRKRYSDRSSTTFVVVEITFFLNQFFPFFCWCFSFSGGRNPNIFCCCAASCGFYAFPLCQEEEEKFAGHSKRPKILSKPNTPSSTNKDPLYSPGLLITLSLIF